MYKRDAVGWSKHLDFIVIDEISLQLAYILAALLRIHYFPYSSTPYIILGFIYVLTDAFVAVLFNSMHNVVTRGFYEEMVQTIQHCFLVFSIAAVYLFATQSGVTYSRIVLFLTFVFHVVIGYITRILWKMVIKKWGEMAEKTHSMMVVTTPENAESVITKLCSDSLADYKVTGIVLTDDSNLSDINGCPVVAEMDKAANYIVNEWIDSVYIDAPLTDDRVLKLMQDCAIMGVPTHYRVPNMNDGEKRFSEKIGGTTVLTSSINYATPIQALTKRAFDICAGIAGSIVALIVMAAVGPKIKKESPGPILFKQERVGQNGKRFTIYKIRSMYMDAEERKAELMDQNRVKDGMMFKLDFDPRIIGNKVLPDGTEVRGIGDKLRKYSLDEWPQFFNVLEGSMSVVGTRPPTVDEWEKYELHHRARLATKPGITGMWQVSGRSEITDFEEVVRLDTEYITNWSPALDLRILFKTIGVLLTREGAM